MVASRSMDGSPTSPVRTHPLLSLALNRTLDLRRRSWARVLAEHRNGTSRTKSGVPLFQHTNFSSLRDRLTERFSARSALISSSATRTRKLTAKNRTAASAASRYRLKRPRTLKSNETDTPIPQPVLQAPLFASSDRILDIHFGICGGFFNIHISLSTAVFLIIHLATWYLHHPSKTSVGASTWPKLRLRMPALCTNLVKPDGSWVEEVDRVYVPFTHFYDSEFLASTLKPLNVEVAPEVQKCPHILYLSMTENQFLETDMQRLAITLAKNWTHPCVLVRVPDNPKDPSWDRKCLMPLTWAFGRSFRRKEPDLLGFQNLRFAQRWRNMTSPDRNSSSRLPSTFGGIHLRIEPDFLAFKKISDKKLDYTMLEKCLRSREPKLKALYIATGNAVFAGEDYQRWRRKTSLQLLNKTDFFHGVELGREEWALVEALMLIRSSPFFWSPGSSLSTFVTTYHVYKGSDPSGEGAAVRHGNRRGRRIARGGAFLKSDKLWWDCPGIWV